MTRKPVLSQEAPQPSGGYSQGIVAGGFLYLAGQGPFDASGTRVGETVAEQVRQVLENLDAVARAAGGSLRNAVRVRDVHQRHGALRRDGRGVPAVLLRADAGAHDDPVRSGRLRCRGRRGRLARRLTWRSPRSTRRSPRSTSTRSSATSRACRATATSTGSRSGRTSRRTSCPRSRTCRSRAGAVGITCQKLGEAEVMEAAGLRDILITFPLVGAAKAERLAALAGEARRRRRRRLGRGRRAGSRRRSPRRAEVGFLVECDTGFARTGVQTPEAAAELARARRLAAGPALRRPDDLPDAARDGRRGSARRSTRSAPAASRCAP